MMKSLSISLTLTALGVYTCLFFISSPATASQLPPIKKTDKPRAAEVIPGHLIVKFKQKPAIDLSQKQSGSPTLQSETFKNSQGLQIANLPETTRLNREFKATAAHSLGSPRQDTFLLKLDSGANLETALAAYRQSPEVEVAEPDLIRKPLFTPNDPYLIGSGSGPLYQAQWNLVRVKALEAMDIPPRGGSNTIKVAIIDSGIAYENYTSGSTVFSRAPELAHVPFSDPFHQRSVDFDSNCSAYLRATPQTSTHANDDWGHGTHVASIIAQLSNNGIHGSGIADRVTLMPIKVLNECGGATSDIIAGINHAVSKGAKVINMSLGSVSASTAERTAIQNAVAAGIPVIAASGNNASRTSSPAVLYPAAYPEVIAVGATRFDNLRADYSHYGPEISLVAPGGQYFTDALDNVLDQNADKIPDGIVAQTIVPPNFTRFTALTAPNAQLQNFRCLTTDGIYINLDESCGLYQGTSMAAPHVTAAVALMLSVNPSLSPATVKTILKSSAQTAIIPGYTTTQYGAGLLNIHAAVTAAKSTVAKLGDLDSNSVVDLRDEKLLKVNLWKTNVCGQGPDLKADCKTDIFDVNAFLNYFAK